jgi:hypothetical protein
MNKDLKDRIFDIPQNILNYINHAIVGLQGKNVHGIQRAKTLVNDKKVKYGQLKRIIHDLQSIDKMNDRVRYDLCGGDLMDRWSKQHLKNERDLIGNRKDSRKQADNIGGITGQRENSHLKTHTKKTSSKIPINLIKSNSHKSSISPITSFKLFEEIEKIKKLIIF